VLLGSGGTDVLIGGAGNDTYAFGRDSAADIVQNDAQDPAAENDMVVFGADIAADQLWFTQAGYDLDISIIGTADHLTLANWYGGDAAARVDSFATAAGDVLLEAQVQGLVDAMAAFAPPPMGQLDLSAPAEASLASVLASSWRQPH
jgi:Ca2+-binding RTX toxin-like protein